jgi:hypothetical protein
LLEIVKAAGKDPGQRVQEVTGRARQPALARLRQHVALGKLKLADETAQLGAVGLRAATRFPKDLLGSGARNNLR